MPKKVLVVDDDPAFAEMLHLALSARGYEVDICLQAPLAFRKIREWQPDLLTLDIMMPGRSGWEIVSQMRSDPHTTRIPVLITTGVRGVLIADEEVVLGGVNHQKIYKPFQLDELYEKVDELVGTPSDSPTGAG